MALEGTNGSGATQDTGGTSQAQPGGLIGRTLGGYPLIGLLGVGGMAEVYRARDVRLKREVAVKVLPSALAKDASYVARFRAEAQRTAAFTHPNVVPVYDYGEEGGLLYLVMPVLESSVRDRLDREGALAPMDAARLAYQVAAALDAAHRRGLVHRDVKPENILLGPDGRAMLTDFGIARELDVLQRNSGNQTLSVTGLPVGTPEYMAPEQLRGQPLDQRIDIYSLGIVFFEMLTGTVPFDAETPYAVAARVLKEDVPPPSSLNPRVWPALDVVVLNAVAKDPGDRYANMRSFATDIRTAASRTARSQPRWIALEKTAHPGLDATKLTPSTAPAERSQPLPSYSMMPAPPPLAPAPTSAPMYVPGGGQPDSQPLYEAPAASTHTYATTRIAAERSADAREPVRLSLPLVAVILLAVLVLGGIGGIALLNGFSKGSGGPSTVPGGPGHATSTLSGTPGHPTATTHASGSGATATSGGSTSTTASTPHITLALSTVTLAAKGGTCTGTQTMTNDSSVPVTWSWSGLPNGSAHLSYSPDPRSGGTIAPGAPPAPVTISESPPCTDAKSATITVSVTNGTASPATFTLNY